MLSRNRMSFGFLRFENVPAPSKVAVAFAHLAESPKFISHVGNSFFRIFAGFGLAALLAIPLGMIIGRFQLGRWTLLPPMEVLRPIPAVAWIPLAILMFASGEQSMIFITFVGAFFPILISTIHGVESLDRRLIDASLTLGAGPYSVFAEVILPGSLPSIVTGLSIGMGTAWFSLVTAEMISGQFGIGYYTWESYTLQNYPDIVLGMIIIGVLGMACSAAIRWVGVWAMPWYRPGGNSV
ncbi:ABC transporter permease [Verrucomicrobia bacterium LW23]|nr:ABC transporter permease [Verrucomicrobia bacterium LW23]